MERHLMRLVSRVIAWTALLLFLVACAGSEEESRPSPEPQKPRTHGLVFYMMGNGTGLETYLDENIRKIVETAPQIVSDSCRIAIYYDRGNYARLTEVKKVDGRTKQVVVKEWNAKATSSVSPEFMTEVLQTARQTLNTDTYGLVLSSHGGGWVPADIFDHYIERAVKTRFMGQDGDHYMETPDLAQAIGAAGHWDYLLFDACFMASVEALYDLRHTTEYVMASAAEVMGAGFPYQTILPLLFDKRGPQLEQACRAYMDSFKNSSATISLVKTSGLEALAAEVRTIQSGNPGKKVDTSKMQGYEGFSPHLYFDLRQYMHMLTDDTKRFDAVLSEAVPFCDNTPTITSAYSRAPITMTSCCGLTCHVDTEGFPETHAAFLQTTWARVTNAQ